MGDMEYQLYYGNGELLLDETEHSPNSKNSWDAPPAENSIDNGDCFKWNELKIDKDNCVDDGTNQRKRKFDSIGEKSDESDKNKRGNLGNPIGMDTRKSSYVKKMLNEPTNITKVPIQWHDDITDINSDIIDSSLTALDSTTYSIGDPDLSISRLSVFKQEAPSPTNDVNTMHQMSRRPIQSPTSTQEIDKANPLDGQSSDQQMINSTISQLLSHSGYSSLQNAFEASLVETPEEQYNVISTNYTLSEDCRFQYVLAAATSIATKINEDTLTYLNQGQSYEIKLKKLGDLSMYRGKMLKSIIRICFHERRLQYMEKEQMALWQKARPGDRILDVDVPLSYGAVDIIQSPSALNLIHFKWDPTKEVGVYIKVNCISTEFTPKKHGGEKGVPFRVQVETYPASDGNDFTKRLHAAACQIKVFKLKGADRKHKQDREKVMKRPITEQEKYQPSYECTVLNDISNAAVLSSPPVAPLSPESDTSSNKSQPLTVQLVSNDSNPGISSLLKQQPQQPIIQVVAPLQQVHVAQETKPIPQLVEDKEQITVTSSIRNVMTWLTQNRFQEFIEVFQNFSGHDLLRLSRNDLIQICGEADGIRFHNVLHDRAITPRTKIYICKPNSNIFHAVFLPSTCKEVLKQELCNLLGLRISQKKKSVLVEVGGKKKSASRKRKKTLSQTYPLDGINLQPSINGSTFDNEDTKKILDNEAESISMDLWSEYGLHEKLLEGIKNQGFNSPTQIQSSTLPAALFGRKDILGAAETGSGKTLAYGLPILNSILQMKNKQDIDEHPLYALILTPTRELAIQVKNHIQAISKYSDINIAVVVGGLAVVKQERILSKLPEIVIATPGRLWDMIQLGYDHLTKVNKIKFLVIDETDRMLERGHFEELQRLLEKINVNEEEKKIRQNFVFSATLTLVNKSPRHKPNKMKKFRSKTQMSSEDKLKKIIHTLGITDPKVVDLTKGIGLSTTLSESKIYCHMQDKDYYVYYFLHKYNGRTIIFCNSIGCVKRLSKLFALLECNAFPLHGSMQQRHRLRNLDKFRASENCALITTDVAARGLDIPCVNNVLHYQVPRTSENYIHRSGRTARASNKGLSLLLIDPSEMSKYIQVCKTLNKSGDMCDFPVTPKYLEAVKKRVNLARDLDKLELHMRKTNSEMGWIQKASKEMDIIIDGMSTTYDSQENCKYRKLANIKKKQLNGLLQKPLFIERMSGKYPLTNDYIYSEIAENSMEHVLKKLKTPS